MTFYNPYDWNVHKEEDVSPGKLNKHSLKLLYEEHARKSAEISMLKFRIRLLEKELEEISKEIGK